MRRDGATARKAPVANDTATLERPTAAGVNAPMFGSDVAADALRALDVPYIALNPGASFRGLHDSIVNYLGNSAPQMLLCLHEETAVAIAHGYAKVTGKPMAAAVHSNVGLMHATMAFFNAWCDRMPVIVLGATGPVDAMKRRPWIDWIHTAQDQGGLVRPFVKWDNQPASVGAAQEAVLRAAMMATTAPCGPVYINLDTSLQEQQLDALPPVPDVARFRAPAPAAPAPALVDAAARLLADAARPVILMGRVRGDMTAWNARVALAERLGATVFTDSERQAAFPTEHPLHGAPPAEFPSRQAAEIVRSADVILSLDWVDLAGTLRSVWNGQPAGAKMIQASVDQHVHGGWSMDHFGLPPVDVFFLNEPDPVVAALLAALKDR